MKITFSFLILMVGVVSSAQVGVNTNTPTNTLDVNGDLRVRSIKSSDPNEISYSIVADKNGVIKKVTSSTDNNYSFNYLDFSLKNVNLDYVSNFDTKIPTSDYTLIVVGAQFNVNNSSTTYIYTQGNSEKSMYNPLNIYAFPENGTWRLFADYAGGAPDSNGNWVINTMAINNSVVKKLDKQEVDLKGKRTGSLASKPNGL